MKLAFSTNGYLKFSFAEAVRRLAALGYTGVEIMADVPHACPACLLEEQKEGVLLLIEPEPGLLVETAEQFLELMQHLDSPAVGLNFDIGHFYCVGDEPAPTVHRLARHIRHFHLEDIAATRVHHHLIPGEGAIDFAATLRAIRAIGYQGWITIELYPYVDDPDTAARTARRRVMEIMSQFLGEE